MGYKGFLTMSNVNQWDMWIVYLATIHGMDAMWLKTGATQDHPSLLGCPGT